MKSCCPECFGDESIRGFIREKEILGDCDYCGDRGGPCASVVEVGPFIVEALLRAFEPSPDQYTGHLARNVLAEKSGMVRTAREAGLSVDLIDNTPDGSKQPLASRDLLIHKAIAARYMDLTDYHSAWHFFKFSVLHDARFFDIEQPRQTLIESLTPWLRKLEDTLKHGDHVYRARLCPHGEQLPEEHWKIQDKLDHRQIRSRDTIA